MFPDARRPWPGWIEQQLVRRGISDGRVLAAFAAVPREAFVPAEHRAMAHADLPLPIGCRQTISQPYVVALSLQALGLSGAEKVLDVGTGSGYQAVLLSYLAAEVHTIEVLEQLYFNARLVVPRHQRAPVHLHLGDGSLGWAEAAPYLGIVVGARAPTVPPSLVAQLAVGGRLVIPVGGESSQVLYRLVKRPDGGLDKTLLERVSYVPLVGQEGTGRRMP
jgi:protein-L-isoaspartate(D-aspartate) O-methyltransferase